MQAVFFVQGVLYFPNKRHSLCPRLESSCRAIGHILNEALSNIVETSSYFYASGVPSGSTFFIECSDFSLQNISIWFFFQGLLIFLWGSLREYFLLNVQISLYIIYQYINFFFRDCSYFCSIVF